MKQFLASVKIKAVMPNIDAIVYQSGSYQMSVILEGAYHHYSQYEINTIKLMALEMAKNMPESYWDYIFLKKKIANEEF